MTVVMPQSRLPPSSCELSVRSCRGHSGQGVEGARSLGRLGHDFELVDGLRVLAMAGAEAVGAGVAAADDHDALAGGQNPAGSSSTLVAFAAAVLLGQELHGEMDAFQFAAGDLQIARMLGAAGQQDGVEFFGERLRPGHSTPTCALVRNSHALGAHLFEAPVDEVLFHFEIRDAVAEKEIGDQIKEFSNATQSARMKLISEQENLIRVKNEAQKKEKNFISKLNEKEEEVSQLKEQLINKEEDWLKFKSEKGDEIRLLNDNMAALKISFENDKLDKSKVIEKNGADIKSLSKALQDTVIQLNIERQQKADAMEQAGKQNERILCA